MASLAFEFFLRVSIQNDFAFIFFLWERIREDVESDFIVYIGFPIKIGFFAILLFLGIRFTVQKSWP